MTQALSRDDPIFNFCLILFALEEHEGLPARFRDEAQAYDVAALLMEHCYSFTFPEWQDIFTQCNNACVQAEHVLAESSREVDSIDPFCRTLLAVRVTCIVKFLAEIMLVTYLSRYIYLI